MLIRSLAGAESSLLIDRCSTCYRHCVFVALIGGWLTLCVAQCAALVDFSLTPGNDTRPPNRDVSASAWPAPSEFRAIVALHPKCPCSWATLTELDHLLRAADGRLACRLLCFRPKDAADDFCDTRLMKAAANLLHTQIVIDPEAKQASQLGMTTSGAMVIYDAAGQLAFYGGVTTARGHAGPSLVTESIERLLDDGLMPVSCHPAYGCSLRARPKSTASAAGANR